VSFYVTITSVGGASLSWIAVGYDPAESSRPHVGVDLKLSAVGSSDVDLELADGDLVMDTGLATAVIASLWTDRRASLDDGLSIDDDPRGHWCDREGDRWGSLLWLLDRAKVLDASLRDAEAYAKDALSWMKVAGMAAAVNVQASFRSGGVLQLDVGIERDTRPRWDEVWQGTAADVGRDGPLKSTRLLFA
jgi:phage gp46-like protein